MDGQLFWRTEVDCWYRDKPRSKVNKRVRRTILVQAPHSDDAFKAAAAHAASTAPMGALWVGFEVISAATVQLPLTIASWHSSGRLLAVRA